MQHALILCASVTMVTHVKVNDREVLFLGRIVKVPHIVESYWRIDFKFGQVISYLEANMHVTLGDKWPWPFTVISRSSCQHSAGGEIWNTKRYSICSRAIPGLAQHLVKLSHSAHGLECHFKVIWSHHHDHRCCPSCIRGHHHHHHHHCCCCPWKAPLVM